MAGRAGTIPVTVARVVDQLRATLVPEFGVRAATADDFLTICTSFGVVIRSRSSGEDGYFTYDEGLPTINVRFDLAAAYRLWVGYHELGHFFMHPLDARQVRHLSWTDDLEAQANAFAAMALGLGRIERIDADDDSLTVRTRDAAGRAQTAVFVRYT